KIRTALVELDQLGDFPRRHEATTISCRYRQISAHAQCPEPYRADPRRSGLRSVHPSSLDAVRRCRGIARPSDFVAALLTIALVLATWSEIDAFGLRAKSDLASLRFHV